ncbi:MAG: T9SS type A sorting domain-containing protein [Sphingobacteriales bacterium]|nr:MAG: T9SS type A sorting domain-containing protein [Sphingobacteriales bacterium]
MKQFFFIVFSLLILSQMAHGQLSVNCTGFTATYSTIESRCASTGSITISATGGSGNYSYRILEPQSLPLTSSSTITGLAPGNYTVLTKDMESGCTLIEENIVVSGSYADPRFQLLKTDVTCINGADGTISVTGFQNGRSPFTYKIVSPSPAAVGSSSTTGTFTSLPAGDYYVQLMDSCGGIQTRTVAIQNYNWSITNSPITKLNCNTASIAVILTDNKGNTNQSGTSFNGFQYGFVNALGDTSWLATPNFTRTLNPLRKVTVVIKDRCGIVKSVSWQNLIPSIDAALYVSNKICSTFDVKVQNPLNLTSPQYEIKQGATVIANNSTGIFTGVPYGTYCLEMRDACYDTTISRCFTVARPIPSVNAKVDTSNQQCNTFTAKINGQTNLPNAIYRLFNSSNVEIAANGSGLFQNIPYGSYCMNIVSASACYDTTIERCFTVNAPKPTVPAPTFTYQSCSSYTATAIPQANVFNPTYCLYLNNTLVTCGSSGSFPGLTYGLPYCIKIVSSAPCYDTTITHCFNRPKPAPSAANPIFSNRNCTTFTVKIPSVSFIPDAKYCLYNSANVQLECNYTGQFDNVPYGSNYYINVVTTSAAGDCPVTTVKKTFSQTRTVPTVGASITSSAKTCTSFTATLTSSNMTDPKFYLQDGAGTQLSFNTTGIFTGLSYGTYKIVATTSCLDTFVRTITEARTPLAFTLQATESCTISATDVKITIGTGVGPFLVKVLNPLNTVVASQTVNGTTYTFAGLAALPGGLQYRVAVSSSCSQNDTIAVTPKTSSFNRTTNVVLKCPSASSGSGSGTIIVELSSNLGQYAPKIIKKNAASASITPSSTTNLSPTVTRYEFFDLTPAAYVLEYSITPCSKKVYDTLTVVAYAYPDLKNSAAYQCDNNNFSVSAVAGGGVSPFNYEIIGSNPSGPSIVTPAQNNSVFDILTAETYSLVRMRAVDACGNGTLNDVSVLPLGQLTIRVNNVDCYSNNLTLNVDTVPNATYTWYLKKKANSTDSTIVTTNQAYNIPYLLPTDTGVYVCKTSVNNGCLMRLSYFNLKGDCSMLLPVRISSFTGRLSGNDVLLNWMVSQEEHMKEYRIERSVGSGSFELVGIVAATNNPALNHYAFTDANAPGGRLRYRLKIVNKDNASTYSSTIEVTHNGVFITAAPNPVKQELTISISAKTDAVYDIKLINLSGQVMQQQTTGRIRGSVIHLYRDGKTPAGIYLVKITNKDNGEQFTQKLIYQ